jgi:dihydroorotase
MHLTIPKPFDAHAHLRDGNMLKAVLPYAARHFAGAIVMPNLKDPVTTTAKAKAYRDEIYAALPPGTNFTPRMTLYLTDQTDPRDLERGFEEDTLTAAKLYPAKATTNAERGVTDLQVISPIFEIMQKIGMPLSIHGEIADPAVDIFDREAVSIDRVLARLRHQFPELKIIFEHITARQAVDYVVAEGQDGNLAATITAHHLRINRSEMLDKGMRPHFYCKPVAKRESDRQALIAAATSGGRMFFLGTDSAPHPRTAKESAAGAAGCFTHINALALYAQVFSDATALDRLAGFASLNGPAFYGLPISEKILNLEQNDLPQPVLKPILTSDGAEIIPFQDDAPLMWRIADKPSS